MGTANYTLSQSGSNGAMSLGDGVRWRPKHINTQTRTRAQGLCVVRRGSFRPLHLLTIPLHGIYDANADANRSTSRRATAGPSLRRVFPHSIWARIDALAWRSVRKEG